jgi:hypothetical protein
MYSSRFSHTGAVAATGILGQASVIVKPAATEKDCHVTIRRKEEDGKSTVK